MKINVLYAGTEKSWPDYEQYLKLAFLQKRLNVSVKCNFADLGDVDYIIYAPNGPFNDFSIFPNVKAILSLWAGVENTVSNKTLIQPLCRMVDEGLTEGMVEYIVTHSLRYHINLDKQISKQDGIWRHDTMVPNLAQDRTIGILRFGCLGLSVCTKIKRIQL